MQICDRSRIVFTIKSTYIKENFGKALHKHSTRGRIFEYKKIQEVKFVAEH